MNEPKRQFVMFSYATEQDAQAALAKATERFGKPDSAHNFNRVEGTTVYFEKSNMTYGNIESQLRYFLSRQPGVLSVVLPNVYVQ